MPYRRLPNTDRARIRALKTVVEKADVTDAFNLPVVMKTLIESRNILTVFEAAQVYYSECYEQQSKAARRHQTNVRKARLYISHFIQVLNLAVLRSEIRAAHKSYYGLSAENNNVPDLSTEGALVEWGRNIIEGEHRRILQGGTPIYNPTIAKVKVHYDIFIESYEKQKNFQSLTASSLETLSSMRDGVDELVLDIWNQIEQTFQNISSPEKRLQLCRDYGVVYYYRTGEKQEGDLSE